MVLLSSSGGIWIWDQTVKMEWSGPLGQDSDWSLLHSQAYTQKNWKQVHQQSIVHNVISVRW